MAGRLDSLDGRKRVRPAALRNDGAITGSRENGRCQPRTYRHSRKWVTCYWWNKHGCTNLGNRELQWYQPGNVTVAEGQLRLRAEPTEARGDDGTLYNYTSG